MFFVCCKTKTKVTTVTNQKKKKEPIKLKKSKLPKARENVSEQVMIGFSFASDWLTEWREVSGSITKRSETKSMQC